ncbi:MAG TPA: sugar transporter [Flavobacteriia bacterium]|jgi:polysaccharide export outer membrane protein|nr:sugar transporter [Flavobacteriia bacterium]
MKLHYLLILFLLSLFQSCTPYKDIVYLQGDFPEKAVSQKTYKIEKGDILFLDIKSSNETVNQVFSIQNNNKNGSNQYNPSTLYFNGFNVDNYGFIEVPIIGKVKAQGKSFEILTKDIKNKLLNSQFKNLDDIYIKIKLAGTPYTVLGEVKSPQNGIIYKENPTIIDVLGDAKEVTEYANIKKVIVIRQLGDRPYKESLDLTDAKVVASPYFYIQPNDIIYVEPLHKKVVGTGTTFIKSISSGLTVLSFLATIILFSNYVK